MHTLLPFCNSPMQSTNLHPGEPENWTDGLFAHVPPTCKLPLPHIPVSTRAGSSRDLPWSWKRAWDIWANTSRVPGAWRAGVGISSAWMSSLPAGSSVEGRDQSLGLSNTPLDTHTLLDLLSGLKGPLKNRWGVTQGWRKCLSSVGEHPGTQLRKWVWGCKASAFVPE